MNARKYVRLCRRIGHHVGPRLTGHMFGFPFRISRSQERTCFPMMCEFKAFLVHVSKRFSILVNLMVKEASLNLEDADRNWSVFLQKSAFHPITVLEVYADSFQVQPAHERPVREKLLQGGLFLLALPLSIKMTTKILNLPLMDVNVHCVTCEKSEVCSHCWPYHLLLHCQLVPAEKEGLSGRVERATYAIPHQTEV